LTHPTAIHLFEDNHAVEEATGGATVGGAADADTAAPNLAAIQLSYEEAKANIVDPAPAWASETDDGEPFPGTEKIDVRTVQLPAVPDGTRGTEAMSVAARSLAEQLAAEEAQPRAAGDPASGTAAPGRRGWWRSIRTVLTGPGTPSDS
jgi:hypothetical protein